MTMATEFGGASIGAFVPSDRAIAIPPRALFAGVSASVRSALKCAGVWSRSLVLIAALWTAWEWPDGAIVLSGAGARPALGSTQNRGSAFGDPCAEIGGSPSSVMVGEDDDTDDPDRDYVDSQRCAR
jgi:hypothetical protein